MTFDLTLLVIGALGCVVVLASGLIRHLPVTEPLLALVVGAALGPEALGAIDLEDGVTVLHHASEVAIAVALMAVALRFPFEVVRRYTRPLTWMVGIGMVAMAAIVAGLAGAILGAGLATAILIGSVLAPTDPVLSSSIVTGKPAEDAIPEEARVLLSAESGFNDGLALPLVVIGMAMVSGDGPGRFVTHGMIPVAVAVVLGVAVGAGAGAVFHRLQEHRKIEHSAFFVFTLVLALLALGLTNVAGGDGILAVFVAGLAYNRLVGSSIYDQEREVEEGVNQVLVLPLFVLLGTVLPWADWGELGWPALAFAATVLALRRLPVVLVLRPLLHLDVPTSLFLGWFGPMGAAALFFATTARAEGATTPEVWPVVTLVVAGSTVIHGITAAPGRALYEWAAHRQGATDPG